jgi:hypothetical protein
MTLGNYPTEHRAPGLNAAQHSGQGFLCRRSLRIYTLLSIP